jgi:hypothetical protein
VANLTAGKQAAVDVRAPAAIVAAIAAVERAALVALGPGSRAAAAPFWFRPIGASNATSFGFRTSMRSCSQSSSTRACTVR